jgi:aminopeptidase N
MVAAQPDRAHTWYPVNDHPSDKAMYRFVVTVPTGYEVVANGHLVSVDQDDATATYRFEAEATLASEVVTVDVGEFERIDGGVIGVTVIRHHLPPDVAESPPEVLSLMPEMLAFFEERFGPCPFDEYGMVVVDRMTSALEAQTASVFGRATLQHERTVAHERRTRGSATASPLRRGTTSG